MQVSKSEEELNKNEIMLNMTNVGRKKIHWNTEYQGHLFFAWFLIESYIIVINFKFSRDRDHSESNFDLNGA